MMDHSSKRQHGHGASRRSRRTGPHPVPGYAANGAGTPATGDSPGGLYHEREKRRDPGRRPHRRSQSGRSHRAKRHSRKSRTRKLKLAVRLGVALLIAAGMVTVAILWLRRSEAANARAAAKKAQRAATQPTEDALAAAKKLQDELELIEGQIQVWKSVRKDLEISYALQTEEQFEKAAFRLEGALERNPDNLDVKMALAEVYLQQKRHSRARDLLLEVLAADPERYSARLALARVVLAQKNPKAALAAATWILEADPYSVDAHDVAATAYLSMDKASWALPHLRKIVNLERDNVPARNRLALTYTRLGQYDKAIQMFDVLLQEEKVDSVTYYNLAVCYAQQKKGQEAAEVLAQAAHLFGHSFVSSWVKTEDFDPIREDPAFVALAKEVSRPLGTNSLARVENE
jgi:tetratricopeptide (TPR) repeat protein